VNNIRIFEKVIINHSDGNLSPRPEIEFITLAITSHQ